MSATGAGRVPSWFTLEQFIELQAAFAFAGHFSLYLDTKITFSWSLVSAGLAADIPRACRRFQQCLNDWLRQRSLPIAYVFVTENSGHVGLHTHWVVAVPPAYRGAFRQWVRRWLRREGGEDVQRNAVKVQTRREWHSLVHWWNFHYLLKGSNPLEPVMSAAHSPDGRGVYLADLIAWPCKSPGHVPFRRYGISHNLGPAQRRAGVPVGADISVLHRLSPASRNPFAAAKWPAFRSLMEDGVFDVRRIYPAEFVTFVRKRYPIAEPTSEDFALLQIVEGDLRQFLLGLEPVVGVVPDYCRQEIATALERVVQAIFVLRYVGLTRVRIVDAGSQKAAEHAISYAVFGALDIVGDAAQRVARLPDSTLFIARCRAVASELLSEARIQIQSLGHRLGFTVRPVETNAINSLLRSQ